MDGIGQKSQNSIADADRYVFALTLVLNLFQTNKNLVTLFVIFQHCEGTGNYNISLLKTKPIHPAYQVC